VVSERRAVATTAEVKILCNIGSALTDPVGNPMHIRGSSVFRQPAAEQPNFRMVRRPLETRRLLPEMAKSEVYRKRNQLRLPNPFVPLPRKTTNTLCNPCAPETGIEKVCQVCQPPVTGREPSAIVGPETLSR
jgi:hypothetical protein